MAIAFVQGTNKKITGVSSTTLAYSSNVASASLLVGSVSIGSFSNLSSLTDNLNAGSWNTDLSLGTSNFAADQVISSRVNTAAGSCTVTYTFVTSINAGINQEEYSGVATSTPLDKTSTNQGGSVTSLASTSVTPSVNGELILSTCTPGTGSITLSNTTSSWTVRENTSPDATTELQDATADFVQSTAAAVTTTWTLSSSADAAVLVATYKPAAGAAPTTPIVTYAYSSN